MKTYTASEMKEMVMSMSDHQANEIALDLVEGEDSTNDWWIVCSEFTEWCASHKGGVLLFEFLMDTGRADEEEVQRLLKAILGDNKGGE